MKSKKLGLLVLTGMLAMTVLAACGSDKENAKEAQASGGKLYIPVISKGFQHQFWQAVKQGAEKAAQEFDVEITFEGPETETQVDKQIEMLQAALDKKPAAIGFAALDSKAATPLLEKAKAANIPVIGFDSGVDSDIPVTTAATNNAAAAGLAAEKMAELIGGKGEIALIVHDQTSRTGIDRRDGFKNRIEEKYPDIKIVDIQYGGGDHLKSTDLTKAIIQAHPDIKGIFGANEGSAVGVVNAVTELKKEGQIVIIGYDSGKLQMDAVRSGKMAGAITQNPIGIGYETVKAAVQAKNGENIPKSIDTGFLWYDKTNIDSDEIKPLLYE
ncbi:BMP family ABC transporter substrate-binding protein [Cohnella sp. CIP 111063]|uniref:ABC transporter substrate-binding protein n=1 Tax=unclassified Cohnella TaxID=2636738 RepID=UPI000B8C3BF6|nr:MULTISPECIES: ABC transporter substrate-binding protein [unclassified Cohnella]OXS57894.1 BMP family ABC transporter substrate-binding protein [Cohnella sp. CIP 111063]PRX71211.1 ribose transport system substrate-binding protein [Cohnella sp. SGD-V74]